jgi:5'-phosphate synthase pdxT subunit
VVETAGKGVEIIARVDQGIIGIRSGKHLSLSFHPELGEDLRLHHLFLDSVLKGLH